MNEFGWHDDPPPKEPPISSSYWVVKPFYLWHAAVALTVTGLTQGYWKGALSLLALSLVVFISDDQRWLWRNAAIYRHSLSAQLAIQLAGAAIAWATHNERVSVGAAVIGCIFPVCYFPALFDFCRDNGIPINRRDARQ